MRWCDTFAATGAGTLKGKRRRQHLAQRWQTLWRKSGPESRSTLAALRRKTIQPSGIAHPCRDGA